MKRSAIRRIGVALWLLSVTATTLAWAQGLERQIQCHAAVGETVRVRGHVNYHPCGDVVPTTITVVQAPTHGTLAVRDEIVRSTDPDLGKGDKCWGYNGQGRVVYYTRTSLGSDSFKYTSSSVNGAEQFDVTVD
jgi:hypothetical protein